MSKCIISIGWNHYVMDTQQAVTVMEALANAELYKSIYSEGETTHHVWEPSEPPSIDIKPVNEVMYRVAKLAGEPK